MADDPWDLGHLTARVLGGTDEELAPEHRSCSRQAGGRLGLSRKRQGMVLRPEPGTLFGQPP